jgi:hypothetical protein
VEPPSERFEVLLTKTISIARTSRGVIARGVTFDRENKLTWTRRVLRDQIDPVLRRAPLWKKMSMPFRTKCVADILLEVVQRNVSPLATGEAGCSLRRVLQESEYPLRE